MYGIYSASVTFYTVSNLPRLYTLEVLMVILPSGVPKCNRPVANYLPASIQ